MESWRERAEDASVMVRMSETGQDALVVKGNFEHISFVYQESTTPLVVFDVVPTNPPKIVELDQSLQDDGSWE